MSSKTIDMLAKMQLMSCKSIALIEVVTRDVGYAKSLLQAGLKYLSITKVEFHCLMQLSLTQLSIPVPPCRPQRGVRFI